MGSVKDELIYEELSTVPRRPIIASVTFYLPPLPPFLHHQYHPHSKSGGPGPCNFVRIFHTTLSPLTSHSSQSNKSIFFHLSIYHIYYSTFAQVTSVYCYKSVSCGHRPKSSGIQNRVRLKNNIQLSIPKGKWGRVECSISLGLARQLAPPVHCSAYYHILSE